MSSAAGLSDLLLEWDQLRRLGQERPVAELCGSRSELVAPLEERIRALESMERRLGPHAEEVPTAAWPIIPGYELLEVIDQGGMGIVYRARQVKLKRLVALKMTLGLRAGPRQLARFRAEAEAVARLQHPNIVQIHDVGESEGRPYFAMELVEGGSLARHLAGKPLSPAEAAHLVETLARAIHYAHQRGIVHRDLKPANILLEANAACSLPAAHCLRPTGKIADFGLAKRLDADTRHTQSGAILGTPGYMAPEQAGGGEEVGPAADIWALGAILYEALTGRPPFAGANALDTLLKVRSAEPVPPRRRNRSVPRDLETICLKCLEKSPKQRYTNADELADDLRRFIGGTPVRARRASTWEHGWRWARRRPERATLFGLTLLVLVGLVAGASFPFGSRQARPNAIVLAPRVRQVLKHYCFECHGQDPENIQRGLNVLDHRLLVDPQRGLVMPGAPDDSRLLQRIGSDGDMPPLRSEELPRVGFEELQVLRDWVAGGASPFPGPEPGDFVMAPEEDTAPVANEVKEIFCERCYSCHKWDNKQGGIMILNHDLLVAKRAWWSPAGPRNPNCSSSSPAPPPLSPGAS